MVAGAVCDPGCPGLEGTEVGGGDLWPDGLSELLEYSSKGRCNPGPGTAQDPVCTQPGTLVLVSPPETSSQVGS